MKHVPLSDLYEKWELLRDIPTVYEGEDEGNIEEPFLDFEVGTPREDIWHWFEEQNPRFKIHEVHEGIRHEDDGEKPQSNNKVKICSPGR